jgi:predicted ATPase
MEQNIFVGRKSELGRLDYLLQETYKGKGQICFVSGEAGTGKTALVDAFIQQAQSTHKHLILGLGNCNAQTGFGDPFLPFKEVIGMLTGGGGIAEKRHPFTDENENRIGRFLSTSAQILIDFGPDLIGTFVPGAGLVAKLGKSVAEKGGLTKKLNEISKRKGIEGETGTNPVHQNQIFEQYTNFINAYSKLQPVVIILDDLHWADTPSINLLFHLSRRIEKKRVMIIGTFRPIEITLTRDGQAHPLEGVVTELKRYYGDFIIDLSGVDDSSELDLVNKLVDIDANVLGAKFRNTLHRQTNGNPLFVVELLKDMKESGALVKNSEGLWVQSPDLAWDRFPARVEGVIERRINRLSAQHRALLTIGCVEGEEFTAEVIAQAQTAEAKGIVHLLSNDLDKKHHLVNVRGVQRLGFQRLSMYQFQHNLFQKYLYNNLDKVERSYLHEDVGIILEALYGNQAATIAVKLARHFKNAGIYEKAVQYLYQAGTRALQLSAYHEAVTDFSEGLALLKNLPQNQESDQQELLLQLMLGQALIATEGYAAEKVEIAFKRAKEICERLGETPQMFPALWGLWSFYVVKGQYSDALMLAQNLLQLAESINDQDLRLFAHFAVGNTSFILGRLEEALDHLSWVEDHYEVATHSSLAVMYGQDPAVTALSWKSCAEWLMGYPDKAVETIEAAIKLARQLDHSFSLAYALYCATWLFQLRQESDSLQTYAQELIPLSKTYGFPFWISTGMIQQGWAIAQEGRLEEAISQMDEAIGLWRSIGAGIGEPYYLGILAEVQASNGQIEAGLALLENAKRIMTERDERWVAPILSLVEGEINLMGPTGGLSQAEAHFQRAFEIAKELKMNSVALRSALRLGQLKQDQGIQEQERRDLVSVYESFSEGFDTPDLQNAKVLFQQV